MKSKVLLPVLLLVMLLGSCSFFSKPSFSETDLIGRWEAPSESDIMPEGNSQYVVFLAEKDSTGEFRYGYMWDQGDHYDWPDTESTYEDFLLTEEWHGNGWFKWKLTTNNLMEYHFMSGGWAEIPKSYTIKVLTETTLTYQDDFKKSHTFTRIVKK